MFFLIISAYCQKEGILHFLTYADSFAVGYFSKQGFSAKVLEMSDGVFFKKKANKQTKRNKR